MSSCHPSACLGVTSCHNSTETARSGPQRVVLAVRVHRHRERRAGVASHAAITAMGTRAGASALRTSAARHAVARARYPGRRASGPTGGEQVGMVGAGRSRRWRRTHPPRSPARTASRSSACRLRAALQHLDDLVGHRQRPVTPWTSACRLDDLPADDDAVLRDADGLGLQVDIGPPQTRDLASPQPVQRERPQVPVTAVMVEDRNISSRSACGTCGVAGHRSTSARRYARRCPA